MAKVLYLLKILASSKFDHDFYCPKRAMSGRKQIRVKVKVNTCTNGTLAYSGSVPLTLIADSVRKH